MYVWFPPATRNLKSPASSEGHDLIVIRAGCQCIPSLSISLKAVNQLLKLVYFVQKATEILL